MLSCLCLFFLFVSSSHGPVIHWLIGLFSVHVLIVTFVVSAFSPHPIPSLHSYPRCRTHFLFQYSDSCLFNWRIYSLATEHTLDQCMVSFLSHIIITPVALALLHGSNLYVCMFSEALSLNVVLSVLGVALPRKLFLPRRTEVEEDIIVMDTKAA